ncbi:hypothetical protein MIR68_010053 [Amoeboaphelidium protococcarum]|nr:hypothetical protein MIR68_010053 [Amoeboaphelidium protococcarum]
MEYLVHLVCVAASMVIVGKVMPTVGPGAKTNGPTMSVSFLATPLLLFLLMAAAGDCLMVWNSGVLLATVAARVATAAQLQNTADWVAILLTQMAIA